MAENVEGVTLTFLCEMDERTQWEIEQKGFFDHAIVNLQANKTVRVHFWDTVRLAQELETELSLGKACLAEPAMIILPSVTLQNMEAAVKQLYQEGFFDAFSGESTSL